VSFINNVIVEIEEKEGHNVVVEKIVKLLVENNSYMKLEKCKWNMREVGFLEVVIVQEEIKMKEKKVKGVLNWPTLKGFN